jgi:hypothetical protein
MGNGLGFVDGGEEEELGNAEFGGAESVVVELGEEARGTAGVEAKAVPDLERGWHPR